MAMHPEVLLVDEPTSALDPTMVGEVLSVIRQLASEGITMLITTHSMRFARDVSTRIFYMDEGIIYEDGTPEQIFEHPVHSATKAFVNRIQKLVYEIQDDDFDFLQIPTGIRRFCIKYNLPGKAEAAWTVAQELLSGQLKGLRPLTLRLTHAELSDVTALDFMAEGVTSSPLRPGAELDALRAQVKAIIEEPTTRGFRVKVLL
jgi:ABC-type sulfate/molybdate transport systems ATPase subunit